MRSLKILIVEDETITAMDLCETLEGAGHEVTATARTIEQAVKAVRMNPPDLALIDIHLEGSSADGIATAKKLLTIHSMPIIYLTANSEPETFQLAKETLPIAYLLKPFRQEELKLQVELAYHYFQSTLDDFTDPLASEQVFLPVDKGYEKINSTDVLYVEADGSYTKVFLLGQKTPYQISANLSHMAQYFPWPNFHRLSRSLLVNLNYIKRIEDNYLFMNDNQTVLQIPVASRKELMKKLKIVRTK
ncbi:response regulator [Spirosoma validum]|uniref:Response regulator n=1 Tax=Spirosoma validum TaxID=2771355 RepID=A0A927GBC8_9BACT|nr:response regulator [Spirosoma validum]MBD2751553.1 response regulator [Spirosoma validum]